MNDLLCHIAGPSGSGKTTILKKIHERFPSVLTKDLDEFDEEASEQLSLDSVRKKDWPDGSLRKLADLRQGLLDAFLAKHIGEKIVLAGFHTEDSHVLRVPTENRFMLDTSAEASAQRAYERSQGEKPEHRRTQEDLPLDIQDAEKEIQFLLQEGYTSMSEDQILSFVKTHAG